jgi:hypothetical protein
MRIAASRLAPALWLASLVLAPGASRAADAREDVFNAYQKMMGSRFAVDITTASNGEAMKSHGEYDTVERIHFTNDRMEMIILPEGSWMRVGGNWTKPPIDLGGMVRQFVPTTIDQVRAGTKNAIDAGATTWNGQPVHAYTYDVDTTIMGMHVMSTNRILVSAAGRIVHAESDGEAMGRKSHTTQDIRYDDAIRVNAPK